jgi:hypothetical protein
MHRKTENTFFTNFYPGQTLIDQTPFLAYLLSRLKRSYQYCTTAHICRLHFEYVATGFRLRFCEPGQTLAPVFVTALTKITIYFLFFGPSAAPPLRHLKNVETGHSGEAADGSFSKRGVTFLSLRFAPVLPFSQLVAAAVVPLQLISNMKSI